MINPDSIERREPVIKSEKEYRPHHLDKQWAILTDQVRKNIPVNEGLRAKLLEMIDQPVSESMADNGIEQLRQSDDDIDGIVKRTDNLKKYLELPPVPDDQLKIDITNSMHLRDVEREIRLLKRYYSDPEEFNQECQRLIDGGTFVRGVSKDERKMVARRYRFARDLKMLSLGAELFEQGDNLHPDQNNEIELPSGVKIGLNPRNQEDWPNILDYQNWEYRHQIKDRVYEIEVGGKKYILKEQKTARHTDTKKGGHKPGLNSAEEFFTARHFEEHAQVNEGELQVTWEKPLAYAQFPDGFQFTVFEYEPGLMGWDRAQDTLERSIEEHPEQYADDFEQIKEAAQKLYHSERLERDFGFAKSRSERFMEYLRARLKREERIPELTFEQFARVKAKEMMFRSTDVLCQAIMEQNYSNNDLDGYLYRVETEPRVALVIVGMDFEYYMPVAEAEAQKDYREYLERASDGWAYMYTITVNEAYGGNSARMGVAAFHALLERDNAAAKALKGLQGRESQDK